MIGFIIIFVVFLCLLFRFVNFRLIVNLIDNNNVSVCGKRGRGKDLLMSNYVAYSSRSKSYVSNIDYKIKKKTYIPLNVLDLSINNDYHNFITGNVNKYVYPYPEKAPILISDAQLLFPAAFESDLKKSYKGVVNFFPVSRHLGNTQVCFNSQSAELVWDKIRVQSDNYILCMSCRVIFKIFVFQNIRIYEKYDSFINSIPPFKAPFKLGSKKVDITLQKINYLASYGEIKKRTLFYINRSHYDSRFIKSQLEKGA